MQLHIVVPAGSVSEEPQLIVRIEPAALNPFPVEKIPPGNLIPSDVGGRGRRQ